MKAKRTEGNWMQFTGEVRETAVELGDQEVDPIGSTRDILPGKTRETSPIAQNATEKPINTHETAIE